uniref:DPH-type MB domain-containing protein n=1 Tax=Bubo bubo TaxID=30461 RepID=A0A8C0EMP8_BUBBB
MNSLSPICYLCNFLGSSSPLPVPCPPRSAEDLENGEDVATCPSCSLILRVIYDQEQFMRGEVVAEPLTNKELIKC